MDLGIRGRVALVTGASRGLGKASASALAREGARVAVAARGREALEATAEEIRQSAGAQVLAVAADMQDADAIEALAQAVLAQWGQIDILVNNAGGPRTGVFTDMADEDWLRALELNLLSTIRLTRLVLPGMRARRWGRIINLTSIAVKQPILNLILSNTARSGVVAMAKTLAGQVAAEGITVNNICPGIFGTDRVYDLARANAVRDSVSLEQALTGLVADIPTLITMAMRMIRQIGMCYGYDMKSEEETEHALHVLRLGSSSSMKAKMEFMAGLREVERVLVRVSMTTTAERLATNGLGRLSVRSVLPQFAEKIGLQLTARKALEIVPVVGAVVGGSCNAMFMNDVGRAAYMAYRRRRLLELETPGATTASLR